MQEGTNDHVGIYVGGGLPMPNVHVNMFLKYESIWNDVNTIRRYW